MRKFSEKPFTPCQLVVTFHKRLLPATHVIVADSLPSAHNRRASQGSAFDIAHDFLQTKNKALFQKLASVATQRHYPNCTTSRRNCDQLSTVDQINKQQQKTGQQTSHAKHDAYLGNYPQIQKTFSRPFSRNSHLTPLW